MPNRILKEGILTSDAVNSLTWTGEIFYRRLMSVVDDFGRYDGRPSIIRGSLYSLKIDKVSESDVVKWMGECSDAGLVRLYNVEKKPYIEILKFGQVLRIKKSKYPECITSAIHTNSICTPETNPNTESEIEVESEIESEDTRELFGKIFFEVKNSQRWIEDLCRIYKKSLEYFQEKLTEFLNELLAKDDYYKGVSEIKKHFVSWLKIQIEKEKNSAKKENGNRTTNTIDIITRLAGEQGV